MDLGEWRGEKLRAEILKAVRLNSVARLKTYPEFLERYVTHQSLESPIEVMFMAWWELTNPNGSCFLSPQCEVTTSMGSRYRLDFVVLPSVPWDRFGPMFKMPLRIGVELDGHDFHERTPAQVTSRDRRDRELTADGWRLMHFSGAEFNRDPMRAVNEVWAEASNHITRLSVEFERWHERNGESVAAPTVENAISKR